MTDILARLPFEKTEPFLDLYAWYLLEYKSLQVGKNIFDTMLLLFLFNLLKMFRTYQRTVPKLYFSFRIKISNWYQSYKQVP